MKNDIKEVQSVISKIQDPAVQKRYTTALDYLTDSSGKQLALTDK